MSDELHQFTFQVNEHNSVMFACKDTQVHKAMLLVNDSTLSIIRPEYGIADEDTDDVKAAKGKEQITIEFFGAGKPFHRALLTNCTVKVVLFTENGAIPSLMIGLCDETLTWDGLQLASRIYKDQVTCGSDNGPRDLTVVYMDDRCGFII